MNAALDTTRAWMDNILLSGRHAFPAEKSDWLSVYRKQAMLDLMQMPPPHRKQEAWRYTNIDALTSFDFEPFTSEFTALQEEDLPDWLTDDDSIRLVFVNGRFLEDFSYLPLPADDIKITSLRSAFTETQDYLWKWFMRADMGKKDFFSSLNSALMNDGLLIHFTKNCVLQKPVEICFLTLETDRPVLAQPRNLFVVDEGANVTLVERYCSTGESVYFLNGVTNILVNENAHMEHYYIQEESSRAFHRQQRTIRQDRNSRYHHTAISLGANWSRNDISVSFDAPGSECILEGLYTVGERQLNDFHLDIQHNAPQCTSRSNFKGVLHGKGRGVFDGAIYVAQDAQKTDAQLNNRNLLLSRDAEIDTKPQLEIYADDVKCSHGTTVGQIEPEQIFYLRTRGIDELKALNMLSMGFAREVLEGIRFDPLREYSDHAVSGVLSEDHTSLAGTLT